ncbi:MAG: hypothetical protein M3281_04855 [Chloroflexota bacterium]|nr:hypothetical protein [Chloroflexota bacterium]
MKRALLFIGIALAVLVVAIVVIQLLVGPTLAEWRDIAVIVLCLFMLLAAIMLLGVAVATLMLVQFVRSKLPELMDKATSTADRVQGTTGFVSERVVSPFIKVSAAAAGARAAVQTIVRRNNGQE